MFEKAISASPVPLQPLVVPSAPLRLSGLNSVSWEIADHLFRKMIFLVSKKSLSLHLMALVLASVLVTSSFPMTSAAGIPAGTNIDSSSKNSEVQKLGELPPVALESPSWDFPNSSSELMDVNFQADKFPVPNSCVVTVAGYKVNVLPLIKENHHPGGITALLQLCGKDATWFFSMTHPGFGFRRLERLFDSSNTQKTSEQYEAQIQAVNDLAKRFSSFPPKGCSGLARFVPKLGRGDPKKGRYGEDFVNAARSNWMESLRVDTYPCSFAKGIAHKMKNFGFGVYKANKHGILAFLEDMYNYLDRLPDIFKSGHTMSAFVAEFPDVFPKNHQKLSPDELDRRFAVFVKRFFILARQYDSLIAGPGVDRKKPNTVQDVNFDFGTTPFAIQGGQPSSSRITRRMGPYPTIVLVPVMSLNFRGLMDRRSGRGERDLFTQAIHQAQLIFDGSVNPMGVKTLQRQLPRSCAFSGYQGADSNKRVCPIPNHQGDLPVQTCIQHESEIKQRQRGRASGAQNAAAVDSGPLSLASFE